MHFSKVSLVICALAMGSTMVIRAEDNPAQAKAREALVSKLFEISAETPVTNPPAAPTKPVIVEPTPAPKAVPAPVVKHSDEPVMKPMNGSAKADKAAKAAQAKADQAAKDADLNAQKEAAKQAAAKKAADEAAAKAQAKMDADKAAADLKAQKAAAKKAADQKAAEIAAAKKQVKASMAAPKTVQAAPVATTMSVPASNGDTPAQAKAREALANSLFQEAAAAPATPATPPAMLPPDSLATKPAAPVATPAPVPAPKTVVASAPIGMAPPLPISTDKQQKLSELLAKYRADQVTPDEYQKQRAAILAEP